jgi:hypothetical protein
MSPARENIHVAQMETKDGKETTYREASGNYERKKDGFQKISIGSPIHSRVAPERATPGRPQTLAPLPPRRSLSLAVATGSRRPASGGGEAFSRPSSTPSLSSPVILQIPRPPYGVVILLPRTSGCGWTRSQGTSASSNLAGVSWLSRAGLEAPDPTSSISRQSPFLCAGSLLPYSMLVRGPVVAPPVCCSDLS